MKVKILRGISGSGKSTLAKKAAKETPSIICSADQYFIDPAGRYKFDHRKLGEAHAFCRGKFKAALELGVELIIVDNTNTQRWEFAPYIEMAKLHNYECEEIIVGRFEEAAIKIYANRNVHGVPLEAVLKMAKRFEP